MKKMICFMIGFFLMMNVTKAVTLTCPEAASPGELITCRVEDDQYIGIKTQYQLENGFLYRDFDLQGSWKSYYDGSHGFSVGNIIDRSPLSFTFRIEVGMDALTDKDYSINLVHIEATSIDYKYIDLDDVSSKVHVVSDINTLDSLNITGGILNPHFDKNVSSYQISVKTDSIDIEAIASDSKAKVEGNKAVIVEVNSETDFVAKNPEFTGLVDLIATAILSSNVKTVEEVMKLEVEGNTIENIIIDKTATIGEKLSFRRFELVEKEDNQVFGTYSHMGGKIVTLAVLEGTDEEVAKDVAMQIAAMRPLYLDKDSVPTERVEKEREILTEQAENEGLDANKLPMIVNGRLNKFYEEVCLLDQGFVKENKMKVSKYVESKNMKVLSFVRYEVGEGMEKREENFADEVAKQMNA